VPDIPCHACTDSLQDSSAITSLALASHTSPPTLVTCHLSTTIRYYPLPSSSSSSLQPPLLSYSRQLSKAHSAPILVTAVSQDSALLAAGSSDGIVKVWDVEGGYVTHIFRGHGGPVSALCFHSQDDGTMELFTGSTDSKVRIYDLRDPSARGGVARPRAVVEGHVSVVRGIDISEDGRWAVTGGRDKVVLVWDLLAEEGKASKKAGKGKSGGPKLVQTVITQEQVEAVGLLPMEAGVGLRCFTGGDRGLVRIWDVMKGEEVAVMKGVEGVEEGEADEDEQRGVISVLYVDSFKSEGRAKQAFQV
jgi:U3 small nucleolar RNA-associated protein 13